MRIEKEANGAPKPDCCSA